MPEDGDGPAGSQALTPELVIRAVAPLLSERRIRRIERVLRHRLATVTVVLENLCDPHNGAAVLRTCEAMGLMHLHVVQPAGPFSFSRRVARSAHKWLTVHTHRSVQGCLDLLERWGFALWAAVPPPLDRPLATGAVVRADRPVALVFGNEHEGLSKEALARCRQRFAVPQFGFVQSLNLSVSVALALQQVVRDRRQALGRPGDLSEEALVRLRAGYYALATRHSVRVVWRSLQHATEKGG